MTDPSPRTAATARERWNDAMRQFLHFAHWPTPAPNIPGCDCRVPDEEWDDVDEDAPLTLCAIAKGKADPWSAICGLSDGELTTEIVNRLMGAEAPAALAEAAA